MYDKHFWYCTFDVMHQMIHFHLYIYYVLRLKAPIFYSLASVALVRLGSSSFDVFKKLEGSNVV